jgi:hypothetical protein
MSRLYDDLYAALGTIPVIDTHTHMRFGHDAKDTPATGDSPDPPLAQPFSIQPVCDTMQPFRPAYLPAFDMR